MTACAATDSETHRFSVRYYCARHCSPSTAIARQTDCESQKSIPTPLSSPRSPTAESGNEQGSLPFCCVFSLQIHVPRKHKHFCRTGANLLCFRHGANFFPLRVFSQRVHQTTSKHHKLQYGLSHVCLDEQAPRSWILQRFYAARVHSTCHMHNREHRDLNVQNCR
jgi:hypothetical protein